MGWGCRQFGVGDDRRRLGDGRVTAIAWRGEVGVRGGHGGGREVDDNGDETERGKKRGKGKEEEVTREMSEKEKKR